MDLLLFRLSIIRLASSCSDLSMLDGADPCLLARGVLISSWPYSLLAWGSGFAFGSLMTTSSSRSSCLPYTDFTFSGLSCFVDGLLYRLLYSFFLSSYDSDRRAFSEFWTD